MPLDMPSGWQPSPQLSADTTTIPPTIITITYIEHPYRPPSSAIIITVTVAHINVATNIVAKAIAMVPQPVATMIERDEDIPAIGVLLDELDHARNIAGGAGHKALEPA